MPKKIIYAPGYEHAAALLSHYYAQQGYEFVAFDAQISLESDYIMLFTPLWQGDSLLVADAVWKSYLRINAPDTKLISIGFEEKMHHNYMFRLDMPLNLGDFLHQSKPCSEKWEPVSIPGQSAALLLKRFYMGHGADSIISSFNSMHKDIKVIAEEIAKNTDHKEIIDHMVNRPGTAGISGSWRSFRTRWDSYAPYFLLLPFAQSVETGNKLIQSMDAYFFENSENLDVFSELNIAEQLLQIKEILNEIGKYVE